VRDGKCVNAASMVIKWLLYENRLSYSYRIITIQLLSYAEVKWSVLLKKRLSKRVVAGEASHNTLAETLFE